MATVKVDEVIGNVPPGNWVVVVSAQTSSGAVLGTTQATFTVPSSFTAPIALGTPTVMITS
jgi:hypothetical protein